MSAPTIRSVSREVLAGHERPEDFRHRAACRSVGPEIFFPTAEAGAEFARQVGIAKAVCAGCPVRAQCLSWALEHQPDGIAGGATEQERRLENLRRRTGARRRLPPAVPVGGSHQEVADAGRAAIAAGMTPGEAAGVFAVSRRTAARWAGTAPPQQTSTSGGGPGGNRVPHQISHANPQAGTRAEGHRG